MMLEKSIDTTARGVIYERGAAAPPAGAELVEAMASYNEIPFRIVGSEAELRSALDALLAS
jgi:hypothetical protein